MDITSLFDKENQYFPIFMDKSLSIIFVIRKYNKNINKIFLFYKEIKNTLYFRNN